MFSVDFAWLAEICGLAAAFAWLIYSGARLTTIWGNGQHRMRALKSEQTETAKTLLKNVTEIDRLDNELKETRSQIETAVQTAGAKREALTRFQPPPPEEIYVGSEFPPAKKSKAWIADFIRSEAVGDRRSEKRGSRHALVWAPDYASAKNLAPRFCPRRDYDVDKVRLLDPS